MREIKFRAWDYTSQIMSYSDEEKSLEAFFASHNKDYDDVVFMQFTGLKDNLGCEIYEGDTVQFTYWWFDGNATDSILTGQIVYSDQLMSFQLKGVKNDEWEKFTGYVNDQEYLTPFSELNFDDADFLVIGNIYENPELIKETK